MLAVRRRPTRRIFGVDALPIAASSCSLTNLEMGEQLGRYRVAGAGAEIFRSDQRLLVVRIANTVPDSVIDQLVEIERACCPFFDLRWDRTSRWLAISVSASEQ